jgi:hypothetical protein
VADVVCCMLHDWADETVKVPQMAESISEGTLKTWQKKVGDAVAVDEEVATIETDKVRNATTTSGSLFPSLRRFSDFGLGCHNRKPGPG